MKRKALRFPSKTNSASAFYIKALIQLVAHVLITGSALAPALLYGP
jgi:hypothetical protein